MTRTASAAFRGGARRCRFRGANDLLSVLGVALGSEGFAARRGLVRSSSCVVERAQQQGWDVVRCAATQPLRTPTSRQGRHHSGPAPTQQQLSSRGTIGTVQFERTRHALLSRRSLRSPTSLGFGGNGRAATAHREGRRRDRGTAMESKTLPSTVSGSSSACADGSRRRAYGSPFGTTAAGTAITGRQRPSCCAVAYAKGLRDERAESAWLPRNLG